MTIRVLYDDDVTTLITMREAVDVMSECFRRHGDGQLTAPARHAAKLGCGELVFTVGGYQDDDGGRVGFRVYDMEHFGSEDRDELVAVFDASRGSLRGLVAGGALGPLRTGAIGGVAVDVLARSDASCLALVGTGKQARTQLMAACAVRTFSEIRAFSRTDSRCRAFCQSMSDELELEIRPTTSAEDAVADADVVICSTISSTAVIESDWISPGTHIQNVGPKFRGNCEVPLSLYSRADVVATDAPAQLAAYGDTFLLAGTPDADRVVALGDVCSGQKPGRTSADQITVLCSLGLAGTEVALADRLLDRAGD